MLDENKKDKPAMMRLLKRELLRDRANRDNKAYIIAIPHDGVKRKVMYYDKVDNWCLSYYRPQCDFPYRDEAYDCGINYGADLSIADEYDIFIISERCAWKIFVDINDNYNPEMTLYRRAKYFTLRAKNCHTAPSEDSDKMIEEKEDQ